MQLQSNESSSIASIWHELFTMNFFAKLERKLSRFALPHLTLGLIICQVLVYLAIQTQLNPERQHVLGQRLLLIPDLVLEGEVWRLITFLIVPPITNVFFAFFFWYLFYLMGTALENHWGRFRYNLYLLIGYLATVGVSFITPDLPSSNGYLQASVFLAFAFLYPDFEISLMFLLPVKIKWLALLTWIGYVFTLVMGDWLSKLLVLASIANYLLFFGKDIVERVRAGRRRMALQAARLTVKEPPYIHRCAICGVTDRTNPTMDFRYCSKCAGARGFCTEHIRNHEHITTEESASEKGAP
jgi:hypothetical protein